MEYAKAFSSTRRSATARARQDPNSASIGFLCSWTTITTIDAGPITFVIDSILFSTRGESLEQCECIYFSARGMGLEPPEERSKRQEHLRS